MQCLKLVAFVLSILICCNTYSQQLSLFSLYKDHYGLINPAAVNSRFMIKPNLYQISGGLSHRTQWIGTSGKISTESLRGEYILDTEGNFAPIFGLNIIHDNISPTGITGIYGRLGSIWGHSTPRFGAISLGLNFGIVEYRINASEIELLEIGDVVGKIDQSQLYPDVGLGMFYYKEFGSEFAKKGLFYAGLSAPQLLGLDLTFQDKGEYTIDRTRHYYVMTGYYHYLSSNSFLEVSTWGKYVDAVPVNLDINVRYQQSKAFWIGLGGAINGTIHAEAGGFLINYNKSILKIGAGFDFELISNLGQFNKAFEVNLSYFPRK